MKPVKSRSLCVLRKKLRCLRELSGLTLQDLARDTGVSASQLCEFETGVAGLRLEKICRVEKNLLRSIRERVRRSEKLLATDQPTKTSTTSARMEGGSVGGQQ